jgi:hypothetical protein
MIRNWIDGRMRRIGELLRRIDSLTVARILNQRNSTKPLDDTTTVTPPERGGKIAAQAGLRASQAAFGAFGTNHTSMTVRAGKCAKR